MSRLIDANALIDRMYHDAFETDTDMQKWDSGCWIRYKMFENAIDDAPTIDAVSVVHGEWIKEGCAKGSEMCNQCGFVQFEGRVNNFCPNCGCRMKGAGDE